MAEFGAQCVVPPTSLTPRESGNRVKTDKRDSRKLALLLAKGMLKRIRTQNRIKAELRFYGLRLPEVTGWWSKLYIENLHRIRFSTYWQQESFESLLAQYEFFTRQTERQTKLLRSLSQTAEYRERVQVLQSIPGVGLTPPQHSSGDVMPMGRITRSGKNSLHGTLVETAWRMISRDGATRKKYEQLKARAGAKRAIVAIARRLLLRAGWMPLDRRAYVAELVAA